MWPVGQRRKTSSSKTAPIFGRNASAERIAKRGRDASGSQWCVSETGSKGDSEASSMGLRKAPPLHEQADVSQLRLLSTTRRPNWELRKAKAGGFS